MRTGKRCLREDRRWYVEVSKECVSEYCACARTPTGACNYCCYCSPGLLEMEAGIPGRLKKVLGMMVWTDRLVWHNLHAHSWEGMLILPDKDIAVGWAHATAYATP